jgi:hypothetical protein
MKDTTKLSVCKPRGTTLHQTRCWLNDESRERLEELREHYQQLLGRPVSTSLLMRRAIGILADHAKGTESDPQAELAQLARIAL